MSEQCPLCGAKLSEGVSCQTIFEKFLALEYSNPEYGEVHFLTVACFMIQHQRYSDEALVWIEQALRAYLEAGIPIRQVVKDMGRGADQSSRTWKINRQPGNPALPQVVWSMTIADAARQYHDPQSYRDLIMRWAGITLREMKPLIER
jgi:hypothetical protein